MCYKGRPTTICSACDDNDGEILYFCDPRVGRNCFKGGEGAREGPNVIRKI